MVENDANIKAAGSLQELSGKIELFDDNIILNEEFKRNVAIPYFKDIFKDLAAQSDSKSKGINKISILQVSSPSFFLLVWIYPCFILFKCLFFALMSKNLSI